MSQTELTMRTEAEAGLGKKKGGAKNNKKVETLNTVAHCAVWCLLVCTIPVHFQSDQKYFDEKRALV